MTLSARIVIVDDERSVRSGLSNLLLSEGYSTCVFDSAEAFLNDEAALAQFLEMLRIDRTFEEGLPRKALIDAFNVISDEDLVGQYRRRMASLLF